MTYIEFEKEIIKELFRKYNIFMVACGDCCCFYEEEVDLKWTPIFAEISIVFYEKLIDFQYAINSQIDIKSYFDFTQIVSAYTEQNAKRECLNTIDSKIRKAYIEKLVDSQILKGE